MKAEKSVLHLFLAAALLLRLPKAELRREESRSASNSRSNSRSSGSNGSGFFEFVTTEGVETTTLPPTSPTTEINPTTTIDPLSFCSMVFDNIGPFCQFVVQTPENGTCLLAFSDTTCESCINILNSCGTTDGSICDSALVSTCPQAETFLSEYCTVVDGVCPPDIIINDRASGSGNGSGSGEGPSDVVYLGSGEPEEGSRTEEGSRSRSGSIPFTVASPTTVTATGMTTPQPLIPLASIESLTAEQRANSVALGFIGIDVQQFTQNHVLTTFREEFANIANMYYSTSRITKRQQQLFTDQDVFVLDSLIVSEGVLIVQVVVGGGQEGQGAPVISHNDMAMLLQENGPRLALTLSSVTNLDVEYVHLIGFLLPSTTSTASPANIVPPTDSLLQLSNNATIGIAIGVAVAVVAIAVVIVIIIVATVAHVRSKRKNKREEYQHVTTNYIEVSPIEDDGSFSSSWLAMSENARGEYVAVPPSFRV